MKLFIHEDAAENIVCHMVAILSWGIQLKIIIHSLPVSHAWLYFSHAHTGFQTWPYFSHAHTGFQTWLYFSHAHTGFQTWLYFSHAHTGFQTWLYFSHAHTGFQTWLYFSHAHTGFQTWLYFSHAHTGFQTYIHQHKHLPIIVDNNPNRMGFWTAGSGNITSFRCGRRHWHVFEMLMMQHLHQWYPWGDIIYGKQPCINPVEYQSLTHWPLGNLNEILDM